MQAYTVWVCGRDAAVDSDMARVVADVVSATVVAAAMVSCAVVGVPVVDLAIGEAVVDGLVVVVVVVDIVVVVVVVVVNVVVDVVVDVVVVVAAGVVVVTAMHKSYGQKHESAATQNAPPMQSSLQAYTSSSVLFKAEPSTVTIGSSTSALVAPKKLSSFKPQLGSSQGVCKSWTSTAPALRTLITVLLLKLTAV